MILLICIGWSTPSGQSQDELEEAGNELKRLENDDQDNKVCFTAINRML